MGNHRCLKTNYAASVTGDVTIELTTDALTLNGVALPAGTYRITTTSAMLGGSGPSNMVLVRDLEIPGTVHAFGLAVEGNRALVTATEGGFADFTFGNPFTGKVVLATLDLSDPENPALIDTQVLNDLASGVTFPTSLGNNLFAMGTTGSTGIDSRLYLIDASNPENLLLSSASAPPTRPTAAWGGGDIILTTDGNSLIIYQAHDTPGIPVTAQVQIPNGTGVAIVPGSFSTPPTQIIVGPDFDTLVWELALTAGSDSITITWETTVSNIKPGESRPITLDTTVDFTDSGTPGEIALPPQTVVANHIIGLIPDEQTLRPGEVGLYSVSLSNPTNASVTYDLSVAGIAAEWLEFDNQVTLPAFGFVFVTLRMSPEAFAALGDYGFVVTATAGGTTDSVEGRLTVAGDPVLPPADPVAHGVVVELTPIVVTAGQGTAANYVVRITNTGSAVDTFDLSLVGLPAGFTVAFAQSSVIVPPGASNFRDVSLTILVAPGVAAGDHVFNVAAISNISGVGGNVNGLVNVVAVGVDVEFMPNSGAPGSTFDLKVTNTGSTVGTFDLSLAGPAALVASLSMNSVTLGPGAFQMVSINVGALDFAFPGALELVAVARSQANAAVQDADRASVNIAGQLGMTAAFDDGSVQLNQPGQTSFVLRVQNIGNLEDQYMVEIVGTTGPVAANLVGLDGQPAQSIPLFILPGLTKGAILLNADLTALAAATVTVRVVSLTNGEIAAEATATISVPTPSDIGDVIVLGSVGGEDTRTRVKVIDPTTGTVLKTFTPYGNSFRGGVRVAVADLNGDGILEIITAPGPGRAGLVKVFTLEGVELLDYRIHAYPSSFTGGVYVATGDVNGDGKAEIVVGNGPGMGPRVRVFDLTTFAQTSTPQLASYVREIRPFETSDRGGVFVAAGNIRGDLSQIIVGNGFNGRGEVEIFRANGTLQHEFTPYDDPSNNAPVHVARKNYDGGKLLEILTSQGSPESSLTWRVWEYNADLVDEALEDDFDFRHGYFVA